VNFGPHHIPQCLPVDWHVAYFADLAEIDARWLRRAVPVLLARICAGGAIGDAGPIIGLPRSAGRHAVHTVLARLRHHLARRAAFDAAVDALTDMLHNASQRVDYQRRRDTLASWTLSTDQWHALTADLVGKPVNGKASRHIDWGTPKRLLASTWMWTRITHGEHHFAPLIRPDPPSPGPPVAARAAST
jgi:hypothetical protein